jgi:hypothetical protein
VVIDFGMASVPGMTTTGLSGQAAVGTPAYMAPEQLSGRRVTAAADMWAWAVSMTFAGTGRLPFTGDSLTAMAFAILHGEPSVGRLPRPLGSLVRRCLDKDPAARPSARDALSELVAAGAQPIGPLPPQAATPAVDDEPASPWEATLDVPEPPRDGVTGPGSRRGGGGDKTERSRGRIGRAGWRWLAAGLLAAVVLIGGASGLTAVLSGNGPPPDRLADPGGQAVSSQKLRAETAATNQAITWIVQQVSRAIFVSCDSNVCAELVQRGFLNVVALGAESPDPLGSTLVVATPAVRAQFGSRLASVYAPAIIASFGSGITRVEIREMYSGGALSLHADLKVDLQARKASDAEILGNSHVTVSAVARAQLLSGDVDPRLAAFIAAITWKYPVRIVDFGDQGPGGGPASLLRSMDLATHVSAAHLAAPAYASWILTLIKVQRAVYLPASTRQVTLPDGQSVLHIEFAAPSPLS